MNGAEEGGREERHQGSKRRMRHKLAPYLPDDTSPAKDEHEAAGEEESPRSHASTLHSASEAERLEQLLRQYVDWHERIKCVGVLVYRAAALLGHGGADAGAGGHDCLLYR
ncbi:unnamed protein product [Vitrella brassicaformis CCMP3155]|uniref:Uncharacterized protein n=1 Tax=Vitrella brassicaformis (strain CCMP3155) TaxID=1169540 RepID=A0A0G4FAD8_VITBC|nr:unnamed protein product [Vitrella brassicaformis CCMP3155]|eukprot:CEM09865.1 unnamed protein product [Vitrella brassicaformis CCMP3155]